MTSSYSETYDNGKGRPARVDQFIRETAPETALPMPEIR